MTRIKIFLAAAVTMLAAISSYSQQPYDRESIWYNEIEAFCVIDAKQTPPKNAVLFVGGSSIRLWTSLRTDMPGVDVINRGFGGSRLDDLNHYASVIVEPYHPRQIFVYSGENDIEAGKTAEDVASEFAKFVDFRDSRLKGTPVVYISMKPSILRWKFWPEMSRGNELVRQLVAKRRNVKFVDISSAMLGKDGMPLPDIYVADKLHMNAKGYAIWTKLLRPYVSTR